MRNQILIRLSLVMFSGFTSVQAQNPPPTPAAAPAAAESSETPRLEIRDYRFSSHKKERYERLVIEFTPKDPTAKLEPSVRVTPGVGSGEANVFVDQAMMTGAIPESLINDSFTKKSRYMSNIAVNMDSPGAGFSIRVTLKDGSASLNPFWLQNPPRLVIDAIGPNSGKDRSVASTSSGKGKKKKHMKVAKAQNAMNGYYCFPAASQTALSIVFQNKKNDKTHAKVALQGQYGAAAPEGETPAPDAIYCYPQDAQITASIALEKKKKMEAEGSTDEMASAGNMPVPYPQSNLVPRQPSSNNSPFGQPLQQYQAAPPVKMYAPRMSAPVATAPAPAPVAAPVEEATPDVTGESSSSVLPAMK